MLTSNPPASRRARRLTVFLAVTVFAVLFVATSAPGSASERGAERSPDSVSDAVLSFPSSKLDVSRVESNRAPSSAGETNAGSSDTGVEDWLVLLGIAVAIVSIVACALPNDEGLSDRLKEMSRVPRVGGQTVAARIDDTPPSFLVHPATAPTIAPLHQRGSCATSGLPPRWEPAYLRWGGDGAVSAVEPAHLAVEVAALRALPYAAYLRTEHWMIVREAALTRAMRRCQLCNSDRSLEVHHRTYERLGAERADDLTVLCSSCHELFHFRGDRRPTSVRSSSFPIQF